MSFIVRCVVMSFCNRCPSIQKTSANIHTKGVSCQRRVDQQRRNQIKKIQRFKSSRIICVWKAVITNCELLSPHSPGQHRHHDLSQAVCDPQSPNCSGGLSMIHRASLDPSVYCPLSGFGLLTVRGCTVDRKAWHLKMEKFRDRNRDGIVGHDKTICNAHSQSTQISRPAFILTIQISS